MDNDVKAAKEAALKERAEEEALKRWGDWSSAVVAAAVRASPKIRYLLLTATRILEAGFPEAAIVASFTALEVCAAEIIIKPLFRTVAWPFDEFADHLVSLVFGRNGKLQQVPKLLKLGLALVDLPSDEMWKRLGQQQDLRNRIVHYGAQASQDEARRVVESVDSAVDEIYTSLSVGPLSEWAK